MTSDFNVLLCFGGMGLFQALSMWLAFELREHAMSSGTYASPSCLHFDEHLNVVTLNNEPLVTLRPGSLNHRFLSHMFMHANQSIPKHDLYLAANIPDSVYINKLIANTKLPKTIRDKAFVLESGGIRLNTTF
ncbi:hypothetical protein TUMSATVNIG1_57610 (plasmid) [Vibrio nigripulchritudo]|uniref:hypothetical protein n=1 Tax=Vibrio nigripulchritudo TaxID=28173 RepID=UPI00190A9FEE|nr:hypothetical protein [Vibrio nigripulchritudo]BCL73775.1 hypothetical protein VNTUMSATTG_57120 [Vibrio nigripulchritudo]BDU35152.1 hypothetical protein TUMSATVNIG1_57610 [Vibrio nigripulchritudo]